jgi:extradiol dioxygenase family protein
MTSIVDHIAILVDDLEIAEKWYIEHLQGKVTFRDDKYTRIKLANTNIALIDKKHYPREHVGVLIENKEDLPRDLGETIEHRDGTIGVYVKDPFGNYLEYIWYSDSQKKVFLTDD